MLTSLFDCPKVIGFTSTTPYDWLEKLASLFHPIRTLTMIRSKTKSTVAHSHAFSRAFPQTHAITSSFDWFAGS